MCIAIAIKETICLFVSLIRRYMYKICKIYTDSEQNSEAEENIFTLSID